MHQVPLLFTLHPFPFPSLSFSLSYLVLIYLSKYRLPIYLEYRLWGVGCLGLVQGSPGPGHALLDDGRCLEDGQGVGCHQPTTIDTSMLQDIQILTLNTCCV